VCHFFTFGSIIKPVASLADLALAPKVRSTARSLPALARYLSEKRVGTPLANQHWNLLSSQGVSEPMLSNPDLSSTLALHVALWQEAATIEPWIGMVVPVRIVSEGRHLLGHILRHTRSLREAVQVLCRFGALATETDQWHFSSSDDSQESWLEFTNQAANLHPFFDVRFFAEMYFTQCVHFADALTNKLAKPLRIEFVHPAPEDDGYREEYLAYYQQTFHSPIYFGCSGNRVVFATELLDVPLARPDTNLGQLLSYEADKRLSALVEQTASQPVQCEPQVRRILDAAIRLLTVGSTKAGALSQENIAKDLGIPIERLQRDMRRLKLGWRAVQDEARKQVFLMHLEQRLSVKEISYLMDFSEPAALQHACKRWYGVSVGDLRTNRAKLSPSMTAYP
jgi:AraC-like DNA-binding protein